MGLLRKARKQGSKDRYQTIRRGRICRFEALEPRQLLAALPPIQVGAVYYEPANGTDSAGNLMYITWKGGAPGTTLNRVTIDTDKNHDGLAGGGPFFHTAQGGGSPYGWHAPEIVSQSGIGSATFDVQNGSSLLTIDFTGFQAGETFVFRIDLNDKKANGAVDAVVDGAEFEGSILTAVFSNSHYYPAAGSDTFLDAYDGKMATLGLDLPPDSYMPPSSTPEPVFTAGAGTSVVQQPLPITISGTVYDDPNMNNTRDPGENGIGGVPLTLYSLDENGDYVSTGQTATTDAAGQYRFEDVIPGTYRIAETQPDGYLSVGASVGTVEGSPRGQVSSVDVLSDIPLEGGDNSIDNNFAEVRPASLSGHVYHDANNNGVMDAGESGIGGALLHVSRVQEDGTPSTPIDVQTADDGSWSVDNLRPGEYLVSEVQPAGYLDGLDAAGTAGGTAHNPGDRIDGIHLADGQSGEKYDFGELLPASLSGQIFVDLNDDGAQGAEEPPLPGVTLQLVDANGTPVATTLTDANGKYGFSGLAPGVYSVVEVQPSGYLEGGDRVGSAGGQLDGNDSIVQIPLASGSDALHYDFWEVTPASISGYVFQDGPPIQYQQGQQPPDVPDVRTGMLKTGDTRLSGVVLRLGDASGVPLLDDQGHPITTVTDTQGYYEFSQLRPGTYTVLEDQPANYTDGLDTPGSKGGIAINRWQHVDAATLSTLAVDPTKDAIVRIPIKAGDNAVSYNFSEVLFQQTPAPPSPPTPYSPPPEQPPSIPPSPPPTPYGPPMLPPSSPLLSTPAPVANVPPPPMTEIMPTSYTVPIVYSSPPPLALFGGAGGGGEPGGYTWHLSVVDGGQPRRDGAGIDLEINTGEPTFDPVSWRGTELSQSQWIIANPDGTVMKKIVFGMAGAVPVTGDWDGSGRAKVGIFVDGQWFLDLNGDGVWDEGDLWARLGALGDQPVTGDWDGDGKTDLGIFGRSWPGDLRAVQVEPGLPDAENAAHAPRYKNIPPDPEDATLGHRTMKRTAQSRPRSDLIDHVFEFGSEGDRAVVGDWNGDGVKDIGVFRDGKWFLDLNGNGRWDPGDIMAEFGQAGDVPIVGDWTGDGISKIGVYRNGTFYLDTNNNHILDADDKVIQLGNAGDVPVSGDFNGDGADEVGVYQDHGAEAATAQVQAE